MKQRWMVRLLLPLLCGLGALANSSLGNAEILDHWYWRNPAPFANSMRSLCFGAGKFVAVGEGGVIHTSPDGVVWDAGQRPVLSQLNRVIYANEQFVAVGNNGVILTSSDGYSWTQHVSGTTEALLGVAFGNGKFVVCGAAGRLVISADGAIWASSSVGAIDLGWIAFGNGVFVLPAPAATPAQLAVRVSQDGLTWSTAPFPAGTAYLYSNTLCEVRFGNGTFVAAAGVEYHPDKVSLVPAFRFFTSSDGTNWVPQPAQLIGFNDMAGWGQRFLTVANGVFYNFTRQNSPDSLTNNYVLSTPDGLSTSQLLAPNEAHDANDMTYGNGQYVLIGQSGKVWVSTNGISWSDSYGGFKPAIAQIIRGADKFIAIADGSLPILVSPDGIRFAPAAGSPAGAFKAVAFDGSNYVAVADGGGVYTSPNGTDWVGRTSNTGANLIGICRGETRWVAVGANGTIITSPTTLAWTLRASGTANPLQGVAYGNGTFVAVGAGGTVTTSSDGGATWDIQFSGTTNTLMRVQFLNGQFFAVGSAGSILRSTDGATWERCNSGTAETLYGITYGNGYYLTCGHNKVFVSSLSTNILLRSVNGVDWQDITTKVPTSTGLGWVGYLDQSFWLAGDGGTLLQTDSVNGLPRLTGTRLPAQAGFRIQVAHNAPATYHIQVCTNLAQNAWCDLVGITNSVSPHIWTDAHCTSDSLRVYRLVFP